MLLDVNDEWATQHRYVQLEPMGEFVPTIGGEVTAMRANPGWRPPPLLFRALRGLLILRAGRARIPRWMEPT